MFEQTRKQLKALRTLYPSHLRYGKFLFRPCTCLSLGVVHVGVMMIHGYPEWSDGKCDLTGATYEDQFLRDMTGKVMCKASPPHKAYDIHRIVIMNVDLQNIIQQININILRNPSHLHIVMKYTELKEIL